MSKLNILRQTHFYNLSNINGINTLQTSILQLDNRKKATVVLKLMGPEVGGGILTARKY